MFEKLRIKYKDGLARRAEFEANGKKLVTPTILFLDDEHLQQFEKAELILSNVSGGEKPTLVYSSNENTHIPYSMLSFPLHLNPEPNTISHKNDIAVLSCGISAATLKEFINQNKEIELFVLRDAHNLLENNPRSFVKTIIHLRTLIGSQKLIYTPGVGEPSEIGILTYLGIDMFDSTKLVLAALDNKLLFPNHHFDFISITDGVCGCSACQKNKEIAEKNVIFSNILQHNYHAAYSELNLVRSAIKNGKLRELVECRANTKTSTIILRELDLRFYNTVEESFPIAGADFYASEKSLYRPDVVRFRNRLLTRYRKPMHKKILLLLPCSAKKPYSSSKSHRLFRSAIPDRIKNVVHEVIVTSPLGVVPRELELVYPARNYDIVVTGDWSKDEIHVVNTTLEKYLAQNNYDVVIVHLPAELWFVLDVLNDYILTVNKSDRPTDENALDNLRATLTKLGAAIQISKADYKLEFATCIGIYQFGKLFENLFADAKVIGRYPNLQLYDSTAQTVLAQLNPKTGLFMLTLNGGNRFASTGEYCVEIDDFKPIETIFAPGVVNADEKIRVGDEVVVVHKNEVKGVGIAKMFGREMVSNKKGVAVKLRKSV